VRRAFLALALAALLAPSAGAVDPHERLPDSRMEERAREISKGLRCLVCQNQTIDDSNAPLARDLRRVVRERLVEGDRDEQVVEFVRARYGDFVLMSPPVRPATWPLWFGPPVLALVAGAVLLWAARRRRVAPPSALSADEERAVAQALKD
jgi:cytochrome c-type biogenesis protein CcmH